jgi:hypothetical protein
MQLQEFMILLTSCERLDAAFIPASILGILRLRANPYGSGKDFGGALQDDRGSV